MNFFVITDRSFSGEYEVSSLGRPRYLPRVHYSRCGHTRSGVQPLPLDPPKDARVRAYLREAGDEVTIDPETWEILRLEIAGYFVKAGYAEPVIYPAVRYGVEEICVTYADELPDQIPLVGNSLFSGRLVDAFVEFGI